MPYFIEQNGQNAYDKAAGKDGFGPVPACLNTDAKGGRTMSKNDLPTMWEDAQQVHSHNFPDDSHFESWVNDTLRKLADVRRKRKEPQTRANHQTLAEREGRYAAYLKQVGVKP